MVKGTIRKTVVVFGWLVFSSVADSEIAISGIVSDTKGSVIDGAVVALASDTSVKDTTDENGEFIIGTTTATKSDKAGTISLRTNNGVDVQGNQLRFSISSPVNSGQVSLFSGNGRRNALLLLGKMESGVHLHTLPRLTPGIYIMNVTIGRTAATMKLVTAGNGLFMSHPVYESAGLSTVSNYAAAENGDTLVVKRDRFDTVKKGISSHRQAGITVMMEFTKAAVIPVNDLPAIEEMPDPLTMNDGTRVTTPKQWRMRRREMIQILEDYEYGHMPPPPGNVKAEVTTASTRITSDGKQADFRKVHLTFGPDEKCGFDLGIFTPVTPPEGGGKGHPVLIYLGYSSPSKSSLGDASAALSRGYAVVLINYSQLGADASNWKSSAFFPSYPDYDWRDFSAWAWGISRAVDYLVTDSLIDGEKIMATGVSRCGQPVLLAGAFDERIALSAPVAGGMALRFSGKEMGGGLGQGITEVVDQGTYWFGPMLPQFRNKTPKLPCDQHWLPALTAPRLFIMCNSFSDEYGRAYAAVQTYLGARPVYQFQSVDENLGFSFRAGGHGMTAEDWSALLDFADQNLLKKGGTKKFNVIPPANKLP